MKKFLLLLLISKLIFANNFDSQRLKISLGINEMISTQTSNIMKPYDFSALMYFNYASNPFTLNEEIKIKPKETKTKETQIIKNVVYSNLMFSIALLNFMELGIDIPLSLYSKGIDPTTKKELNKFNLGDIRTAVKFKFLNKKHIGLGLVINTYIPSGGKFNSNGGLKLQLALINDIKIKKYTFAFNLGYKFKSNDYKYSQIELKDEIFYSLGNKFSINKNIDLLLELYGAFQVSRPFKHKEETPLETLLGANFYIGKFKITPAIALGLVSGIGTPSYRAVLGFGYAPKYIPIGEQDNDNDTIINKFDKCPNKPEDYDNFQDDDGCPDIDNDNDKILDKDDKCPNKPEDYDKFQDNDGCPDLDNDNDKILDKDDKCPNKPEDYDDFQDNDGCPDLDNDNDKILDKDDLCPYLAEDYDKFQDNDGCPDLDNDEDGVVDSKDKCPFEKEDYDKFQDEDGCPE